MTLFQQKCVLDRLLNLYLQLWNQHEPENNFHILADTPPKFD